MPQTKTIQLAAVARVAPSALLVRLRQETRQEHDALERVLDLTGPELTLDRYRQQLQQFYGFYAPLEESARSRWASLAGPTPAGLAAPLSFSICARLNKAISLQQDLFYLGVRPGDLPLCPALPPLETEAAMAGRLYVLEGATLGGRVISQHILAKLGVTPLTGGRFFHGYGDDTGKMWQAMRQWLVGRSGDALTENNMVTSATATFAALRRWCEVPTFLDLQ